MASHKPSSRDSGGRSPPRFDKNIYVQYRYSGFRHHTDDLFWNLQNDSEM